MKGAVKWNETIQYFEEEDCQIEVRSGYVRLNPEYRFDIDVPKFDLSLIGFVRVIYHPRQEELKDA